MNIQIQSCGVVILILLWVFYLRQKPLGLYSVKMFLITMIATSFCIIMDILSIVAINYQEWIPKLLLAFICKTYVVSLVWVGYFGLIYSSMDISGARSELKRLNKIYAAGVVIGSVLIYCLPIYYYLEGNVVYTYGPSCLATYALALILILITIFKVTVKGKRMHPKRRRAVLFWMFIWILAAVIQFMNAELLLVGFASVVGMVILFFELENPEGNLDRDTGAYNAHALGEYMKQYYEKKESFSAILISLTDAAPKQESDMIKMDLAMQEIIQYLDKIKDIKIFRTIEREIILIMEEEVRMQEVYLFLKERFDKPWNENGAGGEILFQPYYVLMMNSNIMRSSDEVFQMLQYFRVEGRKNSGKHLILLDEKRMEKLRERERAEEMILSAIEDDRIVVFYQPIYSTKKKKFVSAEALVRIREKDGTIIPPGVFVPAAEKIGLISQIGEIVFDKTCSFIKENDIRERYGIEYVEVNLSVRQFEERELAEKYISIMEKYGLDPSYINLEITESASIQARKILLESMQRLIDYGVQFSLDDFGNGESNLNYIVDMPVSIVKFDRDMSQAYFANQKARFVMEAAMRMIHDMELKIVSEGVETKEQMETIVALGIDYIQGYYFSKPLDAQDFLKFVSLGNGMSGKKPLHRNSGL